VSGCLCFEYHFQRLVETPAGNNKNLPLVGLNIRKTEWNVKQERTQDMGYFLKPSEGESDGSGPSQGKPSDYIHGMFYKFTILNLTRKIN